MSFLHVKVILYNNVTFTDFNPGSIKTKLLANIFFVDIKPRPYMKGAFYNSCCSKIIDLAIIDIFI